MKTILCFGDSNTWGLDPITDGRHPYERRWTTILQRELGEKYLVIPEGLNGRTTVWDDPIELHKSGARYLPPCLATHAPLDLVIIMLGTNDLKARFSVPACDIAAGVGVLVDIVRQSNCGPSVGCDPGGAAPKLLVLIPPEVRRLTGFAEMFCGARETSLKFPAAFREMARERDVPVLDIGRTVHFSDADGIHFEADQLNTLGSLVANEVKGMI